MRNNPDEGYIKFNYDWKPTSLHEIIFEDLIFWRQKLYQKKFIGAYAHGIGYGNLSKRYKQNKFTISASGTGNYADLTNSHFALVEDYSIEKNYISCIGKSPASSESLSHAAIYEAMPTTNVIVHIHHKELWNKYLNILPTTEPSAAFGTPEMAYAIRDLVLKRKKPYGILIMGGHEEGIISYHTNFESAVNRLRNLRL